MDCLLLGKLIAEKETKEGRPQFSILNNFMHNVDDVHKVKYGNEIEHLQRCLSKYKIQFSVESCDVLDWNKVLQGYFHQGPLPTTQE